ncbi:MAG: RNA 2',3'-cyclic phosphodiesterase [Ignavibacteria bacterium]|jgi:2'-5' RNA ligase|nr:RNA 2',3'-cyclic phosphodiesterase [Ignavibacteria bacterium]MCU7505099.1 RNA 2',3'-cyclic phosphodiesterase [Ignavibacteria bacterium]MCU7518069.1 RNA 2',3'-cyclic phosphodiesterase [Ignavibacteria bacterium]
MNRLFVALKLPDEVIENIVSMRDSINPEVASDFRWEEKNKLHLTLKFLGDTEEEKNGNVIKILSQVTSSYSRISLEYDRFGFFMPRIFWFGLRAENALFELVKDINNDLEILGFQKENRNFKPHITLLRIKRNLSGEFVSAFRNFQVPGRKFYASEVALMKSKLLSGGSVYSEIERFNLT